MAISKIITSSLTDDAVTSAKIGTDQVGADALSSSAISGAVDIPANSVGQSELSIDLSAQSVPHIIPGVLYPAYNNKRLDGTDLVASTTGPAGSTVTSSKYGTVQASDGRMYYYTDIKGSKPIKDPRIGAYFGSQRHKFKSLQLLEQETAMHGKNVYSVDGREWVRAVGNELEVGYDANGNYTKGQNVTAGSFMEVVGYFLDANFLNEQHVADRNLTVQVNGSSAVAFNDYTATVGSPLSGRYVDEAVLINIDLPTKNSASLGINTLRINFVTGTYPRPAGIELIAQDTSNRNNIQIPAQNVVSFGKKFPISATAGHYDPFTTMSYGGSGTTLSALQSLIDTDTSLGMDAWKAGTSNYHRPWNGGRVIKWVDSDGTIKTSVTMMPPNAQNVGTTASNAVSDAHVIAGTNDDTVNFNTSAIDHSLSEVAKTFHFREFGNGNINNGVTGSYPNQTQAGNFADASMLSGSSDNIGYVMDDGLTSLSGNAVKETSGMLYRIDNSSFHHITFIGSGIAKSGGQDGTIAENTPIAQNLPFGTHTLKHSLNGSSTVNGDYTIDGVTVISNITNDHLSLQEISIYQPKRPPIPEDCVVLADYMLMADFVGLGASNNTDKRENISKGVRRLSASRDVFYDNSSFTLDLGVHNPSGFAVNGGNNDYSAQNKISFFGDKVVYMYGDPVTRFLDSACTFSSGTKGTTVDISSTNNNNVGARQFSITDGPRATTFTADSTGASNSYTTKNGLSALDLATPIHTSSHYQTFETPFLHELVGGDRNMEQTNLICSPDGKTWDQITRDTSYLGGMRLEAQTPDAYNNFQKIVFTDWRGALANNTKRVMFNKDFAIAYDRVICLVDGEYEINITTASDSTGTYLIIYVNGIESMTTRVNTATESKSAGLTVQLSRGDYVQPAGEWGSTGSNREYDRFSIKRVS